MKRILASLLSLLLVLSMALAFAACDSVAGTLPDEGNKNPSVGPTDTPADTGKTYTEAEAKIALAGMTAQLSTKKNFAADIALSVNMGMNGMNTTVQIPVSLEADLEAALYHARIDVPGILMTMLGGGNSGMTVEMYLTPDGAYFGTDGDVTDDLGQPVMAYRYEPRLTSDLVAQILGWLQADDTPELPDTDTGAQEPITPGTPDLDAILSGLTVHPKTELKLEGGEKGGYLLTASVDVKDFLNMLMPILQNVLRTSPKTVAAQYLTGELLRAVGEMTVADILMLIDGYIGEETTDWILGVVMGAMTSIATEADGGEGGTDEPVVSETRAAFLSMFGDSKVIELVLGFVGGEGDSAPAYDPDMTEEEMATFYQALAESLLGMIPDDEIGKLIAVPGTEMTLQDLLSGVAFTDCHASVTFTLTDAYLPTAVTAEAAAAVLKTPKSTYACTIGATASLSFDKAVTLPEEMPVLPEEDVFYIAADGDNLSVSISYSSEDFTIASATITDLNGETAHISANVDAETKTVTFTGVPLEYINGEAQVMTLDIEVVFTRVVGERTYTYTLLLTEQYSPMTETV